VKLVKQVKLAFHAGRSHKVYEIDLCEVGRDQFVVNFRYGRFGATLRDGSKTIAPVSRAEADQVFDKLVDDKITKGYEPAEARADRAPPSAPAPNRTASVQDEDAPQTQNDARAEAVLRRLRDADQSRSEWPLERAIWRAGELELREAEPPILAILRTCEPRAQALRRYCCVWALGRSGSIAAIEPLRRIFESPRERSDLRQIAGEALRLLYSDADRERFLGGLIDTLPSALKTPAREGPATEAARVLRELVERNDYEPLHTAYLIGNEHLAPAVLQVLSELPPFADNSFRALKRIYKCAELRRDGRAFGLLAFRFQTERGGNAWRRAYLVRRSWRLLRRLGELGSNDWVGLAVGALVPFTDAHGGEIQVRQQLRYDHRERRYHETQQLWPPFAGYWVFCQLLYRNSRRFRPDKGHKTFRAEDRAAIERDVPEREEAFPQLWDQLPQGLLHLLDESNCLPVHQFAVKALRDNRAFCDQLDTDALIMLLSRPYEVTAQLGFELAERRYDPMHIDVDLVSAVACCAYEPARQAAFRWIEDNRQPFLANSGLIATLVLAPHQDTRDLAKQLLLGAIMPEHQARVLVGRILSALLLLGPDDAERAAGAVDVVIRALAGQLQAIGDPVIRDLAAHPLVALRELAGHILLAKGSAQVVADDLLLALLRSETSSLRIIGARLVGQLQDQELTQRPELLYALTCSEHADLRETIRPVLARLVERDPAFGAAFAAMLVEGLRQEAPDGVHSHLLSLLRDELSAVLPVFGKDEIFKLLRCKVPQAQELGGLLLQRDTFTEPLTIKEIVRLANHQVLAVRQAGWRLSERSVDRLKQSMAQTVRLLDAKWDDSREWAFGLFRDSFDANQLTPEVLVAICDSVRPDVQAFGRELITRYFDSAHGEQYLLKLAEHPSEALQLFATNYLERYASGNAVRLGELEPYFVSILSRVNKGRIAKRRVLQFLVAEALADEASAQLVARIFTRQSVTMVIGDKARLIEGMVRIQQTWPRIALPLQPINAPEHDAPSSRRGEYGV